MDNGDKGNIVGLPGKIIPIERGRELLEKRLESKETEKNIVTLGEDGYISREFRVYKEPFVDVEHTTFLIENEHGKRFLSFENSHEGEINQIKECLENPTDEKFRNILIRSSRGHEILQIASVSNPEIPLKETTAVLGKEHGGIAFFQATNDELIQEIIEKNRE